MSLESEMNHLTVSTLQAENAKLNETCIKLRADLAAARELLEEAAEWLPVQFDDELDDLHARIDAALKGEA